MTVKQLKAKLNKLIDMDYAIVCFDTPQKYVCLDEQIISSEGFDAGTSIDVSIYNCKALEWTAKRGGIMKKVVVFQSEILEKDTFLQ